MAVYKCLECKKKVSSEAEACPHCGVAVDAAALKKKARRNGIENGVAVIVLIGAIVALVNAPDNNAANAAQNNETAEAAPATPDWKTEDHSSMAYLMAEEFIKKRLKAPSTAEFQSIWDGRKNTITRGDHQRYSIDSYVDAENSYGASIRRRFRATVKQVGKNNWQLVSLKFE
jgi:hypothetical protein